LKEWDSAIECFNRALDNLLYATPQFALNNLGEAYRGKGDYKKSIEYYRKALDVDPRFPTAYRGLGLTYLATGDYREAVSALEKAVRYAPDFAGAYFDLGRSYARQRKKQKAISAFRKVAELVPASNLADRALSEIRKLGE